MDTFQSEPGSGCTQCDSACSECHGAGVMQCDICAPRYSNRSVGFCRPCCSNTQKSVEDHCEDCSSSSLLFGESAALPVPTLIILLCVFMILMAGVIFFVSVCRDAQEGSARSNIDYTPLPLYGDLESSSSSKGQSKRRTIQMDSEDSDSESELFNNADNVRIVGRS